MNLKLTQLEVTRILVALDLKITTAFPGGLEQRVYKRLANKVARQRSGQK